MTNPPVEAMIEAGAAAAYLAELDGNDHEETANRIFAAMQSAATPLPVGEEIADVIWRLGLEANATEALGLADIPGLMRKAADLLSRLGCDGGWRDIADAPKDGSILAYSPASEVIFVAQWTGEQWDDGEGFPPPSDTPTHWMPLPAPPSSDDVPDSVRS